MPLKKRSTVIWSCVLWALIHMVACSAAWAEVTLDGTLGPRKTLAGPDYQITADVGKQLGGNLFHSFGRFSMNLAESATFTGPDSVQNIIGRVTGQTESRIDGLLCSRYRKPISSCSTLPAWSSDLMPHWISRAHFT